jgi:hypothetical protein
MAPRAKRSWVDVSELRDAEARAELALHDVVLGSIDATETTPRLEDGTRYTYRLTRAGAPCGGLVVITFSALGQSDSVSVRSAEELLRSDAIIREPRGCWEALERLGRARQEAVTNAGMT